MSPRSNISCSACHSQYDEGEWQALDLIDRVEPVEAARLVLGWSPLHCVEVPGDFQPLPTASFTVLPATAHSTVMLSDVLAQAIPPFLEAGATDAGSR